MQFTWDVGLTAVAGWLVAALTLFYRVGSIVSSLQRVDAQVSKLQEAFDLHQRTIGERVARVEAKINGVAHTLERR